MGSTCTCFNSTDKLSNETNIFTNNLGEYIYIFNIKYLNKIKNQKLITIHLQ